MEGFDPFGFPQARLRHPIGAHTEATEAHTEAKEAEAYQTVQVTLHWKAQIVGRVGKRLLTVQVQTK